MDPLDDVALLQIPVLQQDLLERYVEEARKERGGEDPEDIRPVHGCRVEQALWTLCQTDGGAQSSRPTVLLQLPQDGACHV